MSSCPSHHRSSTSPKGPWLVLAKGLEGIGLEDGPKQFQARLGIDEFLVMIEGEIG